MKNLYLTHWEGDGGDRESYSVFYQRLVRADSKREAKILYCIISEYGHDNNITHEEKENFINELSEENINRIGVIKLSSLKIYE